MFQRNHAISWIWDELRLDSIWKAGGFTGWVQHSTEIQWVKTLVHRVRQAAVQVWGPLMWLSLVVATKVHGFGSIPRAGWAANPGNIAWMSRPRHGELVDFRICVATLNGMHIR